MAVLFLVWANIATLDEIARGDGRVIPSSEVQVIQNLEGGIIDEFLVKQGDTVEEGQVILRLRDVQAGADLAAMNQKYLGLLASTLRLQAEAEGKEPVFPADLAQDGADFVRAERDTFDANKKNIAKQLSVLEQQLSQKKQEKAELSGRIADMSRVLKLANEERDMQAPMVEKGASSKMALLQLDRQIAQQTLDLNALKQSLPRVDAAIKDVEERSGEITSGFRASAQKELAAKTIELNAIRETLAAYKDRSERNEVRSPVRGTVKDIKIKTIGGVARPGEAIMEIVPLDDKLVVEGRLKPSDIAFVHPGQRAIVRLSAFDFSIYGSLEGQVTDISADSITNEKGESYYRVRITTDKTSIEKGGKKYDIIPGMQATVDVVTGEKTVMNYLLKPFLKAGQTALRER